MIAPIFESIADEHTHCSFLKVDVDDFPDVSQQAQVSAMPTFQFWKSGELLDTIVGADAAKLQSTTKIHA